MSKPEEFYATFRVNKHARNVYNTADKAEHRKKHRTISKAFSAKALPNYAPFIQSKVNEISVKLNGGDFPNAVGHWRTFNITDEVNHLMLDMMGPSALGNLSGSSPERAWR